MSTAADDRYRALRRLPPFPSVTIKLLQLLANDDVPIRHIVDLIKADTALTAELLRVVNSPVYGFASRISSLQSAVALLGLESVRGFAITVSMKGFLHTAMRLDLFRRLWRHSLACALLSDEISQACSETLGRDDRPYTAGLLHNIGSLGLFVAHPHTYGEMLTKVSGGELLERERSLFGIDHCEAGGWLAKSWGLPPDICLITATHHQPPNDAAFDHSGLVRVAVLLAQALGFDVTSAAREYTLSELRAMLPRSAQYRFDPDPLVLQARITARLDSFD